MYHLTTDTGLTTTAPTPAALGSALRAEIDQHAATRTVAWTIDIDGLPSPRHLGDIDVHHAAGDHTDFIDAAVQDVVDRLTNDPPPLSA